MSFFIDNEQCIDCRICIPECPDGGISVNFGKNNSNSNLGVYLIDNNKCTECIEYIRESKCASMCPVDAIYLKDSESEDILWNKWKKNKAIKELIT